MAHAGFNDQALLRRFHQLEVRAQELTDNALSFERSPEELLGALRKVTRLEDKEIDEIQRVVDERAAKGEIAGIACSKGCWHCCTQMVAVTIPEVLRLAEHIRQEWTDEERSSLDERIAAHMVATDPYRSGQTKINPRHVCPLLKDAACSVWAARPIVCRAFNSTDVQACIFRRENPGREEDPTVPSITGQIFVGVSCRRGMRNALRRSGLDDDMHEMISSLRIALDTPDAAERYLAGEPIFGSTRVLARDA